ncbi:ABC transporter substrate-binding protein [Streptomyces sp. NPDC094447]|uniref:ABC transporter substrate-binding protein n=1 Tax=Streptomyces sp. NPDC094447 TaxID=3366062 RepID=UPI003819286E
MSAALLATTALWGCGPPDPPAIPDRTTLSNAASVGELGGMDALVAAAKAEGRLNAIAMPSDWANYGQIIRRFEERYGIDVSVENPDGSSQDAVRALKEDRDDGAAVDVVELGTAHAETAAKEGLFAKYRIERDKDIPSSRRDANSEWYANYGGYVSIGCALKHAGTCPRTFADLRKPQYKGKVALNGDPTRSNSALAGVFAAALANEGSFDDIAPGVAFFGELKEQGNYTRTEPTAQSIRSGRTPIVVDWDFKAAMHWDDFVNTDLQWLVQVPPDGLYAGYYATAINREAAHPAAARLWQEFLFSDEAQNLRMKGFARPVLREHMEKEGTLDVISAGWLPKLPFEQSAVPTSEQLNRAKKVVSDSWDQATE